MTIKNGDKVRVTDKASTGNGRPGAGTIGVARIPGDHAFPGETHVQFPELGNPGGGYYFREGEIELVTGFSVGDRVKVVSKDAPWHAFSIGDVGTVSEVSAELGDYQPFLVRRDGAGDAQWFTEQQIEKIDAPTVAEIDGFKVGDRVVLTDDDVSFLSAGHLGTVTALPVGSWDYFEILMDGHQEGSEFVLSPDEFDHAPAVQFKPGDRVRLNRLATFEDDTADLLSVGSLGRVVDSWAPKGSVTVEFDDDPTPNWCELHEIDLVPAETPAGLSDEEIGRRLLDAGQVARELGDLELAQTLGLWALVVALGFQDHTAVARKLVEG